MRELRRWMIAFLVIEAAWAAYLMMALFASDVKFDAQAGTPNFDPFYLMPFVVFLLFSVALWLAAASARVIVLLSRSIFRL